MDQEFKPKNHSNLWTLMVVCAFVGVIFITATFIWQQIKMQENIAVLTKLASEKLKGEQSNNAKDWQSYNSAKFGLSFDYWTSGEGAAAVKEVDHTIYVYNTKAVPETGQYVRIFIKTAGTSLKDAITEQFLKGYNAKDCFAVNTSDWPVTGSSASVLPGWNTATIGFPMTNNNIDPWWENSSKCPQTYTASNGISFFAEDPAHPNQFLFFSIGQYAIFGNASDNSWYQTLKFDDQNSDWQTYENKDLKLSFKYPMSWGNPKLNYIDSTMTLEQINGPRVFAGKGVCVNFANGNTCNILLASNDFEQFFVDSYNGKQDLSKGCLNLQDANASKYCTSLTVAGQKTYGYYQNKNLECSGDNIIYSVPINIPKGTSYSGLKLSLYISEEDFPIANSGKSEPCGRPETNIAANLKTIQARKNLNSQLTERLNNFDKFLESLKFTK